MLKPNQHNNAEAESAPFTQGETTMPQTKTKPAAQPIQPAPPQLTQQQKEAADEKLRLQLLGEFISDVTDMPLYRLNDLVTFKLIMNREHGCTTPIEAFFDRLISRYQHLDGKGKGMTVEDVEWAMEQVKNDDLSGEIAQAHFMASR